MFVDMTINILHKTLSSGTEAAKADTEEVPLEARVESRECMASLNKGTACPHRHHTTINTPAPQQTLAPLVNSILHPDGTVPPPEVLETLDALDLPNHRIALINLPVLEEVVMGMCLMCLDDLNQDTLGRTLGLAVT